MGLPKMKCGTSNKPLQMRSMVFKGFQFYKIISFSVIQEQRLGLPPKFVRKFGDALSDVVVVNDYIGNVWNIKLKKARGKMWLSKGWKQFVDHHSIRVGYFLVFVYDGNSKFRVHIFDMTCTEQINPVETEQQNGANAPIVIPEVSSESGSGRDQPLKQSKPINPSFRVTMTPTYVKFYSLIPSYFVKKYMADGSKSRTVKLEAFDGKRRWCVSCYIKQIGRSGRLNSGWGQFVRDNKLKVGDVCVFELIDKNMFKVHIQRGRCGLIISHTLYYLCVIKINSN